MLDRVHHTSGSLLACTIVKLTLCPLLIAPGRPYQLSDSSLQSTMDASQIRNGPFHFWGQVGLKNMCLRRAIYAPGHGNFCRLRCNNFVLQD